MRAENCSRKVLKVGEEFHRRSLQENFLTDARRKLLKEGLGSWRRSPSKDDTMLQKVQNHLLQHAPFNHDININIVSFHLILTDPESLFWIYIYHIYFDFNYSFTNTRSWRENRYFLNNFVAMVAAEFDRKDATLITLNHHQINISLSGTFGLENSGIFCQWNELLSFLTTGFHSNAVIYQSQSTQVKWLMAKMRENDESLISDRLTWPGTA